MFVNAGVDVLPQFRVRQSTVWALKVPGGNDGSCDGWRVLAPQVSGRFGRIRVQSFVVDGSYFIRLKA